jgi:L-asparaginase II
MAGSGIVPLASIVRSGFTEGHHRGRLVALAPDGSVEFALGDVGETFLPRSSNKPMQAAAMLEHGLDASGELLAIAAASHAGEPFHLQAVHKILAGAGLGEDALQTPEDWPLDEQAKFELVKAGGGKSRITMNCSGKHASMLATCIHNGWSTDDYLDPDHPLQQAARASVERLSGEKVVYDAVDGCGAPLYGFSLLGLAKAFRACVLAAPSTPERRVADAMRAHPEYVSGTRMFDTVMMQGVPGMLAKGGAEGVQAVALEDGRAVAFKVDDGEKRAHGPILVAALRRMGVEAEVFSRHSEVKLVGGGARGAGIQAAF